MYCRQNIETSILKYSLSNEYVLCIEPMSNWTRYILKRWQWEKGLTSVALMVLCFTLLYFPIITPSGPKMVDVLYSFPSRSSGIEPPTKNIPRSLEIADSMLVVSPGIFSAYWAKYWVPYGELKHSWKQEYFWSFRQYLILLIHPLFSHSVIS